MDKEQIEEVIINIMRHDGPDRHVDGYDVITDFILSILNNSYEEWISNYYKLKNINNG